MKIILKGKRPKSWWEGIEVTCKCGTVFKLEAGDIRRDREFDYAGFHRVGGAMKGFINVECPFCETLCRVTNLASSMGL